MSKNNPIEELIKERSSKYGDAWMIPAKMAKHVDLSKITDANFLYVFMTLLSKLVRTTTLLLILIIGKILPDMQLLFFNILRRNKNNDTN